MITETLPTSPLPAWQAALVLGPALVAVMAAWLAGPRMAASSAWLAARWASGTATVLAATSLLAVCATTSGTGYSVRADVVGGVVMLLVAFVGWVIVRYSQPYLAGERAERHYVRWLLATLATVFVVVATNNLLILSLAWTATSLALHRLLTFFSDRPAAIVAAHKKFIVGRLADVCILVATWFLFRSFGTLDINQIVGQASALPQLPGAVQAAVFLVALAAVLKCAQLPFHGWLIQVMEAPTPVSALLHAGVVNLGGFVLMRFAPMVGDVPAAQTLLVVAGTATAVLAALVMCTRISIKVSLAWSTCAQMGFMLMQCGLGAWDMALLHLVAHSLYKAHAFLAAGGTVRRVLLGQLAPQAASAGPMGLVLGAGIGLAMVLAAAWVWTLLAPTQPAAPAIWVLGGIVALALVPLVHAQAWRLGGLWLPALGAGAFSVALSYFGLHALLSIWVTPTLVMATAAPPTALWVGVALAFAALFWVQGAISTAPHGALARSLYPWFYGGLFLDETFNRIALTLWRPPVPDIAKAPAALAQTAASQWGLPARSTQHSTRKNASTATPAGAKS